jgi:hypothetical protein
MFFVHIVGTGVIPSFSPRLKMFDHYMMPAGAVSTWGCDEATPLILTQDCKGGTGRSRHRAVPAIKIAFSAVSVYFLNMNIFLQILKWMCGGLLLCTLVGCEANSTAESDINVTPSSARLRPGQSATFTASGWSAYRWSLSDGSIGTLNRHIGDSVVYTAIKLGSSNTVQVLTCSANTSDTTVTTITGSNTVVQTKKLFTEVYITHY